MALSKEFIEEQKKKLLEEKARLEGELKSIARPSKTNPEDYQTKYENIGDDIDQNAFEFSTYEQNLAIEHDLEAILHQVNQAVEKIKNETYGQCENGDEIQPQRLKVIPWAAACISHSK